MPGEILLSSENLVNATFPCLVINDSVYIDAEAPAGMQQCDIIYQSTYEMCSSCEHGSTRIIYVNTTKNITKTEIIQVLSPKQKQCLECNNQTVSNTTCPITVSNTTSRLHYKTNWAYPFWYIISSFITLIAIILVMKFIKYKEES